MDILYRTVLTAAMAGVLALGAGCTVYEQPPDKDTTIVQPAPNAVPVPVPTPGPPGPQGPAGPPGAPGASGGSGGK